MIYLDRHACVSRDLPHTPTPRRLTDMNEVYELRTQTLALRSLEFSVATNMLQVIEKGKMLSENLPCTISSSLLQVITHKWLLRPQKLETMEYLGMSVQ